MSKNIIIQQKGADVSLSGVAKLQTSGLTGGSVYWVPEDEATLGEVYLTANGVYTAAALGVYSISQATVEVPQGSQAVGSGEDGKYYKVTVVDGDFVYTEVPESMAVTTPPTLVTYRPGQLIDYTGMVCSIYGGTGELWTDTTYPEGTVPLSEILRPSQAAEAGMEAVEVYWLCPMSGMVLTAAFPITVEEEN